MPRLAPPGGYRTGSVPTGGLFEVAGPRARGGAARYTTFHFATREWARVRQVAIIGGSVPGKRTGSGAFTTGATR